MKRNVKFFTIVISLLLLSSAILTGCMYAIAADNGEMKPYDLNGQKENSDGTGGNLDNIVEEAPSAQMPLHGQFSEFLHKDGNTVTVFSEEQYTERKAVRDSGRRTPLTYEEILFLISDSINMYFAYDEIRLYNANADGILPHTLTFSAIQSSSSCIISPYHGDYTEFAFYAGALARYERMLQEIYAIIYYRIYMHDAGFIGITRSLDEVRPDVYGEHKHSGSNCFTNVFQMLAIDGSTVGGIENGDKLASEFQKVVDWNRAMSVSYVDPDKTFEKLNAPILYTEICHNQEIPLAYRFYIESSGALQIVYPTRELTAMKPQQAVTYQAVAEGGSQPILHLDYKTGLACISAGLEFSFAMPGTFRLEDGVLKAYFGESESNPDYCYVFYETDEGFVYSAANSNPVKSSGYDWADGLVFKKYQEHIAVDPGTPPPPIHAESDPVIVEEQWAYLKYDANINYCSLMSSEGSTVIDGGSYVKEDDRLVFMFKTADGIYTYYFNYQGDNVYTYSKGQSNPAPEYGFEDDMEFLLTEFDGGSCFLEHKEE